MNQQLYAQIKKSSKYFSQNKMAEESGYGLPFEVDIDPDSVPAGVSAKEFYCVKGGPGGQYRMSDVNLFMKRSDGKLVRLT